LTVTKRAEIHDIWQAFTTKAAHELSEETRALNAMILRSVSQSRGSGTITQVGANKFFINDAFKEIPLPLRNGFKPRPIDQLRIHRGYFSSIRPSQIGPLLNVNTTSPAVMPPILVSEFLQRNFKHPEAVNYVEQLLKGCTLWITYLRQNYTNGFDMNVDSNRKRTFQQFGLATEKQTHYTTLRKKKGQTEFPGFDPNDKDGTTIFDYFSKQLEPPVVTSRDVLCVNVGKRVRGRKRVNETWEDFMRDQVQGGACWIPADLLEICPNQSTRAVLAPAHAKDMIKEACRLPNANAALIDKEGLQILGIKGSQQGLVSKPGVEMLASIC
jgi:hypothetical protein